MYRITRDDMHGYRGTYESLFSITPFGASANQVVFETKKEIMEEVENPHAKGDVFICVHPDEHCYRSVQYWRGTTDEEAYRAFLRRHFEIYVRKINE